MIKKIFPIFFLGVLLTGCDDLFEPAKENNLGIDYMYQNPEYADGVLGNAYTRIPTNSYSFNDVATDDAVSNDATNSYRKMAAGAWAADNNPTSRWDNCRAAIQYINLFLSKADGVAWAKDELVAHMFRDRVVGEAYALRAMHTYYLLQAHGGYTADGELLGIPLLTEPENQNSNFNVPRNTFEDCMQSIYTDISESLKLLPDVYKDITQESEIPEKYRSQGVTVAQYNRAFGSTFFGRMSGRIAEAVRSQAALLAASPAFSAGNTTTWADAAGYAATVLDRIDGVNGLDPTGATWYNNTQDIKNLVSGSAPKEILWRGEKAQSNSIEADNYPPSIWGKGRINPTQNIVDAFPMLNGYPITATSSGYNPADPYTGRDPRLALYVVLNGSRVGVNNNVIHTAADYTSTDDTQKDVLNNTVGSSTRTGYYMRKLMRQDINLDPNATTQQDTYHARIRYTEIFLNYAEAANEAWGPTGSGSHAYSAYDVIKAIRHRAGIGTADGDAYLESVKGDKDKMRELIHNERRLELCFEGFRFWDLRRWNTSLTETARGLSISGGTYSGGEGNASGYTGGTYQPVDVDARNFNEYMNYGPVPYSEVLKYSELKQNKGW